MKYNKMKEGIKLENIKNIFKGVGISIIVTLIALLIFSVILTYTNVSENTIAPVVIVVTALSILCGSSISTKNIKKNGMINGGLTGLAYLLILYIISSILNWEFSLNIQSLIMILVGTAFGILGGIIGVNRK